jgi:hypothetical protein
MKRIFITLILISLVGFSFAEKTWIKLNSEPSKPGVTLLNSNVSTTEFLVQLPGFWKMEVETSAGEAWLVDLGNHVRNLEKGAPDLPYVATSLIIPDHAKMKVEIVSSEYRDFKNVLIAPSKGNLYRDVDPAAVPYEFGKIYQRDDFYPGKLARLNEPYIVRDFRGQAVWVMPFQYNPVTKVLRVYYNIKIKVSQDGQAVMNAFNRPQPLTKIDDQFEQIYEHRFLNYSSALERYDPVGEHGNMLIISYGDFMDEMEPFVAWKKQSGTPVEMVDVATIGNSNAIKQYVADYYNNKGLTFLLLVGDAEQVPSSYSSGDSDNDYTYVVGNDHYPDLFCGRFSAQTEQQVVTQVERILNYEMNPDLTDTTWYTKALGIASDQGPGDDDEYDYQHVRNIQNNKLIPYTYTYGYELFDGSQGGNDASGSPLPADVKTVLNQGATIVNYTGHGGTTSWSTTGFSNSDITNLSNAGKLPFIFSVACVNGNFVGSTCFAEAWMRSEDADGNPIGAVATIMSTINQSWNPPMCGQDAMNDIMVETYPNNIKRTFGGITMNGCMEMNDTYDAQGSEMTDTWTIFGDPSMMVRTAVPKPLEVSYQDVILVGSSSFFVNSPVEGAVATLSKDDEILGSAIVQNGTAEIVFDAPLSLPGTAKLIVTGFNKIPLINTVEIIAGDGPFVIYNEHYIDDTTTGNGNGHLDYNETAYISMSLKNVGTEMANAVSISLFTDDPFITLIDSTCDFGSVDTASVVYKNDVLKVSVSPETPNGHIVYFKLETIFDGDTSISYFNEMVYAPSMAFVSYEVDDATGNNNGRLDPGETVNLVVDIANYGFAEAFNVTSTLMSQTSWVSVTQEQLNAGNMQPGDTVSITYEVSADGDTPLGLVANFNLTINADLGIHDSSEFTTVVGKKPIVVINMGSTNLSSDSMMAAFNKLSVSADMVTDIPDDLGTYQCAFVLLGIYSDNHVLTDDEGQKLAEFLDNGGRIYMEGGDTWAYNGATPVHPYFHIEGTDDGSDSYLLLKGDTATFMDGFVFSYDGANNWMDEIIPMDSATTILTNYSDDYTGPAVIAYENETYKTIGSVCEFGGLHPGGFMGTGGNQAGYMALMLNYFGMVFTWTGVDNSQKMEQTEVKVYPNPFNKVIHIEMGDKINGKATFSVYDLQGRMIKTMDISSEMLNWDASADQLDPGVYFYRIVNGNKESSGKIVYTR